MTRRLGVIVGAVALAAALSSPAHVRGGPSAQLLLVEDYTFTHGPWTDANGVPCLSDENLHNRTWAADKYTGSLTASLYICPANPNAPLGSNAYSLWASFVIGGGAGSASLTLTYPNGTVVPARYNPVTGWTEVCVLDPFLIPEGVYTLTFTADRARQPIVKFQTEFAENVRGQYWWGCDSSWGPR